MKDTELSGVHPDIITISVRESQTIEADRADVFLSVAGSSLITGNAALHQAREIRALVEELTRFGIEEAQIRLENVRAETQGNMLGRSSSAHYALKIEDVPNTQIADVLGIVSSAKNTTFNRLEWSYSDIESDFDSLLDRVLASASNRAARIGAGLNVRVIGVWDWSESRHDPEAAPMGYGGDGADMMAPRAMRARVSDEELGLAVSHAKEISLSATVKFRVAEMAS